MSARSTSLEIARAVAPLGWTAFGGPQAHIGLIQRELVIVRKWTDEQTFAELLSLCSILPGPTSTQLVIGLGAIRGGVGGAVLALLVWMFPASLITTLGGIGLAGAPSGDLAAWLAGAQVAAVALVALAAWTLGRKLVTSPFTAAMCLMGTLVTVLSSAPLTFPLVLLAAGALGVRFAQPGPPQQATGAEQAMRAAPVPVPRAIAALAVFAALLVALPLLRAATGWRPLAWFDAFYRAGALVFGGGQVLLSILLGEVTGPGWLTHAQFLNGLGLVQALPGPLFSIGGYVGGYLGGVGGALICLFAIFLPGLLLVIGLLPFWDAVRHQPRVRAALVGVNACAVGLIVTAVLVLYAHAPHGRSYALLLLGAYLAAARFRVPAPLVILGAVLLGRPLHVWLG